MTVDLWRERGYARGKAPRLNVHPRGKAPRLNVHPRGKALRLNVHPRGKALRLNVHPRGMILVAILVVVVLASMVAAGLMFRMRAETAASVSAQDGEQAYRAAMSGVELVTALFAPVSATDDPDAAADPALESAAPGASAALKQLTTFANPAVIGDSTIWYENPDLFKNRLVHDDGANKWYFTIYSPNAADTGKVRFGLTDESSKINLAVADAAMLARLPGMTTALVDALMDYTDKDADARAEGAEQEYYDQLPQPYQIKNGPLSTIEELLLVKGFNAGIVYGEDANLNTLLEPNEDDADETFPPDNNDGVLSTGLFGAATTVSYGPDLRADGKPKSNLNGSSRTVRQQALDAGLSAQTARFIEAYRADGNQFAHPSQLLNMTYTTKGNTGGGGKGGGRGPFGGRGPGGGNSRPETLSSGVSDGDMAIVLDNFTTAPGGGKLPVPGLVNVNTAPVEVLAALPGLDAGLAQSIVDARANLGAETKATTAWLLTQGLLDSESYKSIAPRLTTQGYQYRLRVIGFGVPCNRYRIIEVVLDLAGPQPKVLYQRDLTKLGLPFALEVEEAQ